MMFEFITDVVSHWDQMMLRSWAMIDGERVLYFVLYQEGSLALIRPPLDLIRG